MLLPEKVTIVEVGPRDGLQNETAILPASERIELIERLAEAGLASIEAGSFVSPRRVPQMAGTDTVFTALTRRPGVAYPALVANLAGLEAAIAADVGDIAIFASASEGFSQANLGCSRAQSLSRLEDVAAQARARGMSVRAYLSCIAGCPFDGDVPVAEVTAMARALMGLGCTQISLGDTIGTGTAGKIRAIIDAVAADIGRDRIAMHFHDTYGQGLANVLASLLEGIATFDSSVAGLGGCPFAPGASGNVATEDVLYLLEGLGIETGVDAQAVARTGAWISARLGRENASRAGRAMLSHQKGASGHGG